jgi:hypothetical protein
MRSVGRGPRVLACTNLHTDALTVNDGKFRTFLRIISYDSGGVFALLWCIDEYAPYDTAYSRCSHVMSRFLTVVLKVL